MSNPSITKPLFAIAVERKTSLGWKPNIVYMHATDVNEASFLFRAAHSREIISRKLKIVGIALAVGYFHEGKDSTGEVVKDILTV